MAAIIIKRDFTVYSPADRMKKILEETYPSLLASAAAIISAAGRLTCSDIENDPTLTAEKIFRETEALYQKEKLVLFPFIAGLLAEGKKSESCAPFKNVKLHYTALLTLLQTLRAQLAIISAEEKAAAGIVSCMDKFEKNLIELQKSKDEYLFKPLKSCNGCTTLKIKN